MPKESISVRTARDADIAGILEVAEKAYHNWPSRLLATERNYQMQLDTFPEGQFVAVTASGLVVGYATSLIVAMDGDSPWYAHGEITGWGSFSTHNPAGNSLYGADIAVHPDFQRMGVSRKLYQARKNLMRRHNLKQMVAGGRLPGYGAYRGKMKARQYVAKVLAGEIQDPSLNAHIRAGYRVEGVHFGYIEDEQSLGYATHLVMDNPRHQPRKRMISAQPIKNTSRKARICAIQYEMRRISNWEDHCDQVDYFIETANSYDSHLLVFPELFIAQMLCTYPRESSMEERVSMLTDLLPQYLEFFKERAVRHQMMIVAGSVPVRQADGSLRNVAHLFSPGGNVYTQEKLHVTPGENQYWGIQPGEGLKVFHTPIGRIAILICYDIEFPELSRILVDAGVDLIVVPFATDERKSYLRVRYCAQARAVENTIYVALAGNVGGLPRSPAMTVNFGQAAILTPSDFAFPLNAIAAEGVLNTQTVVVCDIDIGSLEVQREVADVKPLMDRRSDLYSLVNHVQVERVKVI